MIPVFLRNGGCMASFLVVALAVGMMGCARLGQRGDDPTALKGATMLQEPPDSLYVSPTGNDANTGLGPESDQALRTIQAAVDRLQPGGFCFIQAGIYRETVTFTRSGQPGKPMVLAPYRGEKVLISGCDSLDGWTLHEGDIWKADMPWTLGLGRNQAFDGEGVLLEARCPNEPSPGLEMAVSGLSPLWPTFGEFSILDPDNAPGRVTSKLLEGYPDNAWKGACYYGVHFEGWSAQTGVIESSKSGQIDVEDRTKGWWFASSKSYPAQWEEGRGMIVGHMNALDRPGEWCWKEGVLYLIPRDGRRPASIEAKRRQLAFDLSGCEHIEIRGLNVKAASMRLDDSAYCVIDRCALEYITHHTLHYGIGDVAHDRNTLRSGETGIFVDGHDNAFFNCSVRFSAGAGFLLRGFHHTIHNCLIDEVSYTSHYLNAVTDAVGDFNDYEGLLVGGHVLTYNTLRNAGRHFFNIHGNGTSLVSRTRGPMDNMATLFAHNHLYNGMLVTRDAGFLTGYYCSGGTLDDLNGLVAYNVMHDCYDIFGMRINALGIVYLDAGTCDVDLHHNLLWAAPGSHQRGIWYNTMCVDIREQHNVFHPLFTRTCAQLSPEDFPEGKPFRFGHDFTTMPPVPRWPQLERKRIEASAVAAQSAGILKSAAGLSGLKDKEWFCVGDVDFGEGWRSAVLRFASDVNPMNTDRALRAAPRHQKATDPLVLEATVNDGAQGRVRSQWTFVHNVFDKAWLRFDKVPLGQGYRRVRVIYGNVVAKPRWVEIRLDRVDGPLVSRVEIGTTDVAREGRIQIYDEAVGQLDPSATGVRDVFVVFRSEDEDPVGEFEYFRFEQAREETALQPNDVRLEMRVDSPSGDIIGEFFPRSTGGADRFRFFVATLEPVEGQHPLYVSIRSNGPQAIGAVQWISLEKAVQPMDMTGIGTPALRDRNGRLILPSPTNLPCARPADRFVPGATRGPRPLFLVRRLSGTIAADGCLDEWPIEGSAGALEMTQSFDGRPSDGPASAAWVACDDEALYIAAVHPVNNAGTFLPWSGAWTCLVIGELPSRDP